MTMRARTVAFLGLSVSVMMLAGCLGQETRAVYPITEVQGLYTIRIGIYQSFPRRGIDAVAEANKAAVALRRAGHEAYVADLKTQAIVTVGLFNDPNDPRLKATWQRFYEEWQRKAGNTTLGKAQEILDEWHGKDTPFGSKIWPVPVIELQVKMKRALGTVTEADEQRYQDYLEAIRLERKKRGQ